MVLIFSDSSDVTCVRVIQWLVHWNIDFLRITKDSKIKLESIDLDSDQILLSYKDRIFDLKEVKANWFRRSAFTMSAPQLVQISNDHGLFNTLTQMIKNENQILEHFVNQQLKSKPCLGNPNSLKINKIKMLQIAKRNGLSIPASIITSKKEDVIAFLGQYPEIITKPIHEIAITKSDFYSIITPTKIVTREKIDNLSDTFAYSLFQEYIDKEYEIRCFFLDGQFFSNAIFFERINHIHVDRREFEAKKKHRRVPYNLPKELKTKLISLMKNIELNCASIDFLKKKNGDYVFLEINPIGQFGMTSYIGNYQLEQKIAKYLCQWN